MKRTFAISVGVLCIAAVATACSGSSSTSTASSSSAPATSASAAPSSASASGSATALSELDGDCVIIQQAYLEAIDAGASAYAASPSAAADADQLAKEILSKNAAAIAPMIKDAELKKAMETIGSGDVSDAAWAPVSTKCGKYVN